MAQSVRRCANCKALHPKIVSWIDALGRPFWFCSMQCKQEFLNVKYPEMRRKEIENEEESKRILPEVRELVARKTKEGIAIVHRYSGVRRGADTEQT